MLWMVLLSFAATACTYIPTRSLDYEPVPVDARLESKPSLLVRPLAEDRPPRHYPNSFSHLFLTYVPLLPYVKIPYERLDESAIIHESRKRERVGEEVGMAPGQLPFTVEFAGEIARDLWSSGMFERVTFDPSEEKAPSDYDFLLNGSLRSTEFDKYVTSYMLGAVGVLVWLVPIPNGLDTANVEIDLALADAKTGDVVWTHGFSESASKIYTFYNGGGGAISSSFTLEIKRYGRNDEGIDPDSLWAYHASALREGMGEAKASLAGYLQSRQ